MSIFDIFSKRQKQLRGEMPDVYGYDNLPEPLKVQIIHIWRETIGDGAEYHDQYSHYGTYAAYKFIVDALCREYGFFVLPGAKDYRDRNYLAELANYLLQELDAEKALDAVELSFRVIDRSTREFNYLKKQDASKRADAAIEELNVRFREHGVGFQYVDEKIIRVDAELIHQEVVKPALALLRGSAFAGAQAEFLKAHEHYRHGNEKEALAECLKAFESVMKVICKKRKWRHASHATSHALIQVLLDNGLIPSFWEQHFSALRSTLESGVPTARNRLGGHGQGSAVTNVPPFITAYVLHLTASAIVFLCEAERALP